MFLFTFENIINNFKKFTIMTTFSLLEQKFSESASVQLFLVQDDNCQSWLVQSIHKRLTGKWFSDFNSAKSYFDHKYLRH